LWVPDGEMSSVDTLSPRAMSTGALTLSGTGRPRGTSLMFGPLITRASAASAGGAGGTRPALGAASAAGAGASAAAPAPRGSVITPVAADTAAVTGEHRYTESSPVPLRPGKLRLNARRLFVPVAGTWPMPAQEPHVGSETFAPAASRSVRSPSRAMTSRMRWLPGKTTKETVDATWRPCSAWGTAHMSSHELLVQEPTTTCSIGVPATSRTGTT